MFMLVCFVYVIVPYQESTTLQLCRTAAAVGNTIHVGSHMTDNRQHAESTTLQPCRTAAAVGNAIYVRVACPRYSAASCLCRNLSCVTPPYHTLLLYAEAFKKSNNLDRPTNPSLYVYVHRGSFLTSIFSVFFFAKIANDRQQQTTCGEQNATTVVGPCARAVSSP